jgi:metal-responsive CopG/Arc/MetJ family transcriptional regulator
MVSRMDQAKTKLSITLAPDIIEAVDRAIARQVANSRSAVIETWLRRASRIDAEARLREETIAYYESLSETERAQERAISRATAKAARRLSIDE